MKTKQTTTKQPKRVVNKMPTLKSWSITLNRTGVAAHIQSLTESQLKCRLLGALGFSYRAISEKTGLKFWKIGKELHKANIKLAHYRNGVSTLSKHVVQATSDRAIKYLENQKQKEIGG